MLSVVLLIVANDAFMVNAFMLSVVMLNVVAQADAYAKPTYIRHW
jgi:hypothetical protein